jgi:hypothetical protein
MKTTIKWIFFLLMLIPFAQSYGQTRNYLKMMDDMSINFYTVCDSADAYFAVHGTAKGSGYTPYQRWKHQNESSYYPSGDRTVDHFAAYNSYEELRKAPKTKLFQVGGWKGLGPDSITRITGHYAAGMGRVKYVEINRNNPQQMYVCSKTGGLWRTSDDGVSWSNGTDYIGSTGAYSVTASPTYFDSILLNVCLPDYNNSFGIYRSIDGGQNFQITGFTPTALGYANLEIYVVKYHPRIPNLVFVGTNKGVFRSTDNLQTWTQLNPSWKVSDIEFHSTDNSIIYLFDDSSTNDNRIQKSTNQGISYQAMPILVGNSGANLNINVSSDCENCVYASSSNGLWKSLNGASSFTSIAVVPAAGQAGYIDLQLLGINDKDTGFLVTGYFETYISSDGGVNFTTQTNWHLGSNGIGTLQQNFENSPTYVHCDVQYVTSVDSVFYICTDGFMSRSYDNGVTWQRLTNICIRDNYCLGTSQSQHSTSFLGSQDNGLSLIDSTGWTEVYGADGMECIVHPLNEDLLIGSTQKGNRRRSINSGLTSSGILLEDADWVAPILLDPNDHFTLYHFGLATIKSSDLGNTWDTLGTPSTITGFIKKAAIAENNSQIIVIARNEKIERSLDGGLTYQSIQNNLPNRSISDIAFDPTNDSTIIITYDNIGNNSRIYITNDLGTTWSNITYNLTSEPIKTVVIDHSDQSIIYLGGLIGFYKKAMDATNWDLYDENLPNCMVRDLEICYGSNSLKAATYGRGLWEYTLDGRASYPAIMTTDITDNVTWTFPKETMEQFVTSTISYNNTLTSVYVKWSVNNSALNNTILMTNIADSTWRAVSSLPTGVLGDKVYFKVFAVGENGDTTETYKFMYQIKPYEYCAGSGANFTDGNQLFIQNFSCNNVINNASGNTANTYFSNLPIILWKDSTYSATANINTNWGGNDFHVWIDYNDDAVFPQSELVVADPNTGNLGFGQFTVPNTVMDDTVKMRVRLGYWAPNYSPCGTTPGEVEDYPVYLRSAPNLQFSGNLSFCLGQNANLTYTGSYTDSLNWILSNGVTNFSFSGNSITSSILPTGSYSVTLNGYKYGMLFTETVANAFTIYSVPVVGAGTDITVCQDETVTVNASGANQYVWNAPFTVNNGLPFTPPVGTHTLSVTGTDVNGCVNQDNLQLIVNSSPIVSAGTDITVCQGEAVTVNASGANQYVWNAPFTVNNGLPFTPTVGTHTLSVTGTDVNGCVNQDNLQLIVNSSPIVSAGTDITVCQGEAVTVNASGANQYVWNAPFTVNNGLPFTPTVGTHTLSVTGTDINGCANQDDLQLIVNSGPTAVATINGSSVLESNAASTYQWIDCSNETSIVGASNQFYTPLTNGIYAVVVSNNLMCIDTSDCVTYSLVGINELPEGVLAIYPNPSNGVFMLSVTKDIIGQEIEITGTLGELVHRSSILQLEQKIDLSKYASGTYFLSFKNDPTNKKYKLIRL